MNSEKKTCSIPNCTFKGSLQPIENFHIKSRAKNKVYRDKRCSSCAKRLKATKKSKGLVTSSKKEPVSKSTHKRSRPNYEFFLTTSDESILKSYNESASDHELKQDEFNDITKAILLLFQIEEQLGQNP